MINTDATLKENNVTTCTFIATASQQGRKYLDGSGETALWTDGLMVSTCDHREDNCTSVKLKDGKSYKVTVIVEECL